LTTPGKPRKKGATTAPGRLPKRAHPAPRSEVLFGIHPVREMLRAGRRTCHTLWLAQGQDPPRIAELRSLAEAHGIFAQAASAETLAKRCQDDRHQGVVAEVSPFACTDLERLLSPAAQKRRPTFLLALDSLLDPQNLGAILRSAQCAGIEAVILPKDRSVRPTPVVSKASAGALEHTCLVQVTNLANTLADLKVGGFWVAGTDAAAGESLFESDLTGPLVVVIGSEGKGMRPLVRRRCDFLLTIPQAGTIGSLNASAAAAVVFYEAFRQRRLGVRE
jgi:23S rRNA (guanosine2251-2'-O)-methyltransferase